MCLSYKPPFIFLSEIWFTGRELIGGTPPPKQFTPWHHNIINDMLTCEHLLGVPADVSCEFSG